MPVLIGMTLGGVEISRFVLLHQKLERVASSVADLTSQSQSLALTDIDNIMSAVQFSCSVSGGKGEWRLIGALDSDRPPEVRLLALTILVRMHAPRSITKQWQTLDDLKDLEGHSELPWLRDQLRARFAPANIDKLLKRSPPKGRYDNDPALESVGQDQQLERAVEVLLAELDR